MDKSLPGAPSEPAYPEVTMVEVMLPTPKEPPASGEAENESLQWYPCLSHQGLLSVYTQILKYVLKPKFQ